MEELIGLTNGLEESAGVRSYIVDVHDAHSDHSALEPDQHIHTATPLHNKTVNNLRYYRKVFCIVTIASLVVYIWKN